jgi:hypothetical protein
MFGKPENLRKGAEWPDYRTGRKRTVYVAEYPSNGLTFSLLTNPSELFSIIISTKDISVRGLLIGDTLETVRERLGGSDEWNTDDSIDSWWLTFEKHDLRFRFERNKDQNKYPISLSKPELVTEIDIYNNKLKFGNLQINGRSKSVVLKASYDGERRAYRIEE